MSNVIQRLVNLKVFIVITEKSFGGRIDNGQVACEELETLVEFILVMHNEGVKTHKGPDINWPATVVWAQVSTTPLPLCKSPC